MLRSTLKERTTRRMLATQEEKGKATRMVKTGWKLCGVLSFEGRSLPKKWRCGVCRLSSEGNECEHCRCSRVADWQQEWLEPGKCLNYQGIPAIVTEVLRLEKKIKIVILGEERSRIIKVNDKVQSLDPDDVRIQKFLEIGLCCVCDRSFKLNNWRKDNLKLQTRQQQIEEQLKLLKAEKENLKLNSPNAYKSILHLTAEIKRLQNDLIHLKRQIQPSQLWCPFCLSDLSDDFKVLDPASSFSAHATCSSSRRDNR